MKVFNTLSGRKEDFLPQGDVVKMYVCGVTPYDDAHIGHAMSYIIFDVIRRYLKFQGYQLKYVQNITDIDDKIIARANSQSIPAGELARKYSQAFLEDMTDLNVEPADIYPYATGEIPKILEVVQGLVDKGYAYQANGSVYFRVRSKEDYGKLSRRNLEQMMAGARIESSGEKEYPMDFVLWKASKPGEPSWESPWGPGRPGWHIECSAMSLKYLGDTLDIHGGGQDLVFPHHENEIAQSESFTGRKPFVKYWLHNGLLRLGEEKMSKSLGNLITIKEALPKYSADAIRLFVLSSHYRSPLTYSEEALGAAERGVERLRQAADEKRAEQYEKVNTGEIVWVFISPGVLEEKFKSAMDDDFGTPRALSWLFTLANEINRAVSLGLNSEVVKHRKLLKELASVLGLTLKLAEKLSLEANLRAEVAELHQRGNFEEIPKRIEANLPQLDKSLAIRTDLVKSLRNRLVDVQSPTFIRLEEDTELYEKSLDSLRKLKYATPQDYVGVLDGLRDLDATADASTVSSIAIREEMRQAKQWQQADEIRTRIAELGVVLEDTPEGTKIIWKRKK